MKGSTEERKKKWKQRQNACRKKKKLEANINLTPPSSPDASPSISGNQRRGRKVVLRHRSKCVRQNKKLIEQVKMLQEKIKNERKKTEKYKKRLQRQDTKQKNKLNMTLDHELTPKSKTTKMLRDLHDDLSNSNIRKRKSLLMNSKVARALTFHNTITSSIKEKYKGSKSKMGFKRHISSALSSKLIQRYRLQTAVGRTLGLSCSQRLVQLRQLKENKSRFLIENFFLSDDVSRTTAGIKETVTKKKIKKQKRYLLSDLKSLYKKFTRLYGCGISYTTFTRYRPFFVLKPSEVARNTCLCKQHTNMELKATKLKQLHLIDEKDPHKLYILSVCDKTNCKCMYNLCKTCKSLTVPIKEFNPNDEVKWEKWVSTKETRQKSRGGEQISVQVQISAKVTVNGTLDELTKEFHHEMALFRKHAFNIKRQNVAYADLKKNLKSNEAIIHADFSENYACKLAAEVQSFHFGGSRNQVTLHTGIMYTSEENPLPFATVSSSREHGPPAIWAHLKPVLEHLKIKFPDVSTVHFFSDGPSSQYKQKKNFYLFSTQIHEMGFKNGTWSFFESSHGKGAPDGVGGVLKRLANHYVAHGYDITDATVFFRLMQEKSKVTLFYVSDHDIEQSSLHLPNEPLKTIRGTRDIHQIITSKKNAIMYRTLSCFCRGNDWERGLTCNCFFPAQSVSFTCNESKKVNQQKKTRYREIYSSSESESDISLVDTDDEVVTREDLSNHLQRESEDQEIILETPAETNISEGTFVIVELLGM